MLNRLKHLINLKFIRLRIRIVNRLQKVTYKLFVRFSDGNTNALLYAHKYLKLTPENLLLKGIIQGVLPFPSMADHSRITWCDPEERYIIPIKDYHIQSNLRRIVKKSEFEIKINHDFNATIKGCATARPNYGQTNTWLSNDFVNSLIELNKLGFAHSIEAYQENKLVGGIIGVSINGYFRNLSLFHIIDNASRIAFVALLEKLQSQGFILHDCGWTSSWLNQFGAQMINKKEFQQELLKAFSQKTSF